MILLGIWFVFYAFNPKLRKEMLIISVFTTPTGLAEPIFIGRYWSPPSLFNLNVLTGFDIESLIFSFAVGGIVSIMYESVFKTKHSKIRNKTHDRVKLFHFLSLLSPFIVFFLLYLFTELNPIYTTIISLFVGSVLSIVCRPDLVKNMFLGGVFFTALYFVFFLFVSLADPSFVSYWNLSEISGILVAGIPLEELLYAFTFGMLWSGIYEHTFGYELKK